MAHRDDHQAALARAAALERDLRRERKRAATAERRAATAEQRAATAEQRAATLSTQARTPIQRLAERSLPGDPPATPSGAYVLFVLLLILSVSVAAVVGALWLVR